MRPSIASSLDAACAALSARTAALEAPDAWPAESFAALADAGVLRWSVPAEYGGEPPLELVDEPQSRNRNRSKAGTKSSGRCALDADW